MNKLNGKEDLATYKNLVGTMAIVMHFSEVGQEMIPQKLVCYGSLPLKNNQMTKIFTGDKCHLKFLLWAL
jgi:hypothetical protein